MPIRVVNGVEKNIVDDGLPPVIVVTNTPTDVLPDLRSKRGEWVGRYIQNIGANDAYYAFGRDCQGINNCNGLLSSSAKQQLDVSNCGQRVSVYSTGGTTIAITSLRRKDNDTHTVVI